MAGAPSGDVKLYDDEAAGLVQAGMAPDKVSMLPGRSWGAAEAGGADRSIRIMWGQDMLRDILDGRYRAVVCGVNDETNAHGMVAQLVSLVPASQWREPAVTSYAKLFQQSVSVHAKSDREPYILKYDLDSVLVLAMLRPRGRDHFTLADLGRGFSTIAKMLKGRRERLPVASVSFLGARSNRLVDERGGEPSFETVLRTMHEAGYRGDVYPSPQMWSMGHVGVFPSYPFPEGLARMRQGGH